MKNRPLQEKVAHLLGIGLDEGDGHVRLTQGKDFSLYMGSEETHGQMQALCLALEKKLLERGQAAQDLSKADYIALLEEIGRGLESGDEP